MWKRAFSNPMYMMRYCLGMESCRQRKGCTWVPEKCLQRILEVKGRKIPQIFLNPFSVLVLPSRERVAWRKSADTLVSLKAKYHAGNISSSMQQKGISNEKNPPMCGSLDRGKGCSLNASKALDSSCFVTFHGWDDTGFSTPGFCLHVAVRGFCDPIE